MIGDSIQTLNLHLNELNSKGITNLSFGLMVYTQLVELDVGYNDIDALGVTYLDEGLTYCILLEVLNLKGNNITFEGVHALIDIMENCNFLQKLDVSINPIGMDGGTVLIDGWKHKSLLTLDLYCCFEDPHYSALLNGRKCCDSCDKLLHSYYNNDYVHIELFHTSLPKLINFEQQHSTSGLPALS